MDRLLRNFIFEVVKEQYGARVPNQLMTKKNEPAPLPAEKDEESDEVDEASGAGSIVGYTAPLASGTKKDYEARGTWK